MAARSHCFAVSNPVFTPSVVVDLHGLLQDGRDPALRVAHDFFQHGRRCRLIPEPAGLGKLVDGHVDHLLVACLEQLHKLVERHAGSRTRQDLGHEQHLRPY